MVRLDVALVADEDFGGRGGVGGRGHERIMVHLGEGGEIGVEGGMGSDLPATAGRDRK
jgi:hypothetical protein